VNVDIRLFVCYRHPDAEVGPRCPDVVLIVHDFTRWNAQVAPITTTECYVAGIAMAFQFATSVSQHLMCANTSKYLFGLPCDFWDIYARRNNNGHRLYIVFFFL